MVNGVQPGKHENGFSGTEGSPELLELSHHSSSPGSIIPFGDKEPFLKQAVVKPPQVTGERRGGLRGGRRHCSRPSSNGASFSPHPHRSALRARPWLMSPRGHLARATSGPPQPRSCCQNKHRAAPLRPPPTPGPATRSPGGARPPARTGASWFLSRFSFLFHFIILFYFFLNMHLIRLTPSPQQPAVSRLLLLLLHPPTPPGRVV